MANALAYWAYLYDVKKMNVLNTILGSFYYKTFYIHY
jgi:hypothetical protein